MLILAIANGWKTAVMITLMIVVFYFFLIRPQNQKAKAEQRYRDSLAKGNEVMTTGGIHGVICGTDPTHVQLEVAKGVRISVAKTAITPIPTPKEKKK